MGLMYPNGYTQPAREWAMNNLHEEVRKKPDQNKVMKVIDHDLPDDNSNRKMVGLSWWKVFPKQRTQADLDAEAKESKERGMPPDANHALLEEFRGNIMDYKKEILGTQPYVLLSILAVVPEYQRKGVGSILLDWGSKQADELGLHSYLEASPMGRPLYERKGYEKVREFEFDARKWGHHEDIEHVCMLRPARDANGKA
ncbi:uncharacterized protein LTR77_002138 [Saxophila tyrrhenica]|uniref:N-acetyltransferase domain-containing protein n=1 Tax=Saxophila tyrrhenica TaxID=1690608 RepID=A0AAV9PKH4_9PEZI|nr:hypothetical protein LTR77_002138 [Saxophila tyrrhenica]